MPAPQCHERPNPPSDCVAIFWEREAMAMVLNEAGATYHEAAAFIAISGRKPLTPALIENKLP